MNRTVLKYLKQEGPSERKQIIAAVIGTLVCCGLVTPESALAMQTANTEATLVLLLVLNRTIIFTCPAILLVT